MCSKLTAGHTLCNMLSQGYEKLDTLLKTAKQRSRPPSASSSDSSGTTEETTDMVKAGRYQEDAGPDSASERQAEYDLVMLRNAPAPTAQDNTVYAQVFLNLQVSPFDQYTFPPPPVLTPSNIPDDLVPPTGSQDQQHTSRQVWLCSC